MCDLTKQLTTTQQELYEVKKENEELRILVQAIIGMITFTVVSFHYLRVI